MGSWIGVKSIKRELVCWPETNRLPAKIGLFGISRELQLRVCSHGEPRESPRKAREEHFYREEKEVGRAIVNKESMTFHWLRACQERRGIFLLPVGLCYGHMRAPSSGLLTLFNWGFCLLIFILWKNWWIMNKVYSLINSIVLMLTFLVLSIFVLLYRMLMVGEAGEKYEWILCTITANISVNWNYFKTIEI